MTRIGLAAIVATLFLAGCAAPSGGGSSQTSAQRSDPVPVNSTDNDIQRRARIRLDLAGNYYQSGNYQVALDELRQAIKIDPDFAPAYNLLGLIYMDMKDQPKAEESFQRGLRMTPDDSEMNNNYGWYLCQTNREAQSFPYYTKALQNPLYKTPARPLHNAGICSLRMGDEKGAESYFLKAFRVDASDPVAMFNLSEIYLRHGDDAKAKFYVERLMKSYQPSAETLWLALRVSRRGGDKDGTASYASQLRRLFPDSRENTLLTQGKYDN